ISLGLLNAITQEERNESVAIPIIMLVISLAFFFYYRHTSKILNSYSNEEADALRYLKFVTPVVPVIYFSTVLLIIVGAINLVMFVIFLIGVLIFVGGIIVTLGLVL